MLPPAGICRKENETQDCVLRREGVRCLRWSEQGQLRRRGADGATSLGQHGAAGRRDGRGRGRGTDTE